MVKRSSVKEDSLRQELLEADPEVASRSASAVQPQSPNMIRTRRQSSLRVIVPTQARCVGATCSEDFLFNFLADTLILSPDQDLE